MSTILEYKCPCCGGAVNFDSGQQKMVCPYCDTEFDIEVLKKSQQEDNDAKKPEQHEWESDVDNQWSTQELEGMKVYVCQSCGGELIADENAGAMKCPYCDNPVIMKSSFSGDLRPNYIIPFKLDKKAAKAVLYRHLKRKPLLPKVFKSQNHIDEIKGVYVPFWLFDCDTSSRNKYKATKIRRWSDSNYDYTETSYFDIYRDGDLGFKYVPVDGSEKMPDDLMESVEPFDYSKCVDFDTAYLAGYMADKYDVDRDSSIKRANERIKNSTADAFRKTVHGYSTVTTNYSVVDFSNNKSHYALLPVWILNTTWKNEKYLFAMNGQSGKFVGDLPIDWKLFWTWFFGTFGIVSVIAIILMFLLG